MLSINTVIKPTYKFLPPFTLQQKILLENYQIFWYRFAKGGMGGTNPKQMKAMQPDVLYST